MHVKAESEGAPESKGAPAGSEGAPAGSEGAPLDMGSEGAPVEPAATTSSEAPPAPAAKGVPPSQEKPRTKAEQTEVTTSALLAAARELFAERGYAAVGTEEIVQRAGVTRGALYHHFRGGKEELFRKVLVQISAEMAQLVVRAASTVEDPWEELVVGIDAFLDACATREVQRILLVDGPAVLGWDAWRTIDAEYGLGLLEAAVQRAIDAGRLPPQPAKAVAHVLLGALDEAAMVVARAQDTAAARVEMGRTVHRLLAGLQGPDA